MFEKENVNVLTFRQGYEELYQLGYQTADLMVTDLNQFQEFGINQTRIDNLNISLELLKNRTYDELMLLKQQKATETKNEKVDELKAILFRVEVKIRTTYGRKSYQYKDLGISSISTLTDMEVALKAGVVASIVKTEFADLYDAIINEAIITSLKEKSVELTELIKQQKAAIIVRTISTQQRTILANNLYTEISKIRYVGKQMWLHSDYIKSKVYQMPKLKSTTNSNASLPDDDDDETFVVNEPVINDEPDTSANS